MYRLVSFLSITEIPTKNKAIYLTFDDGPEPGITESILNILQKYNAKATFFCTGENFEKHPGLVQLIKENGHVIGNHTYSHTNGLKEKYENYIDDVIRTREIIKTNLFRPPWGALSVRKFLKISKCNRIIMWSISSSDTNSKTDWVKHCQWMVKRTKPGRIILFHFSSKHSLNTMQILPKYLVEIQKLDYEFRAIQI